MGALFEPFLYIIGFVVDIYFKVVVVEIVFALADLFQDFGSQQQICSENHGNFGKSDEARL